VEKVGLAVWRAGALLTVRKRGSEVYILPGGKPEKEDADERATLRREIREELCCDLDEQSLHWIGTFTDEAADEQDKLIEVHLFEGKLCGQPRPCAEIEEVRWFNPRCDERSLLAPSIRNEILPHFLPEERGS
jgi:8-oxo-dGTP diphosphatase